MLGALLLILIAAILNQIGLVYLYHMADGSFIQRPNFLNETRTGIRLLGVTNALSYIGIWLVKFSFISFFYRLAGRIKEYLIFWWIVVIITLACGAGAFGVGGWSCEFSSLDYIISECVTPSKSAQIYTMFKVSVALDVFPDALSQFPGSFLWWVQIFLTFFTNLVLVICFPVIVLWRVRVEKKKKVILMGLFLLVVFTIAVTIIRGSMFGGAYKSLQTSPSTKMNTTWIWFWLTIEFDLCMSALIHISLPMQHGMPG